MRKAIHFDPYESKSPESTAIVTERDLDLTSDNSYEMNRKGP